MPSFYRLVSSISCRTYSSSTSFLHWPTCLWTALLLASSVCSSPVSDLFHVYCSQSLSMLLVCLSPSLQTYSTPSFSLISLPIIGLGNWWMRSTWAVALCGATYANFPGCQADKLTYWAEMIKNWSFLAVSVIWSLKEFLFSTQLQTTAKGNIFESSIPLSN